MKNNKAVVSSFSAILFLHIVMCLFTYKAYAQTTAATISGLHFIGEYDTPYKKQFRGTTIGGLSGIDYDADQKVYYLISDDRSDVNPVRFYTAKIFFHPNGIDSVQYVAVTTLHQPNGKAYPNSRQDPRHTPDPEALRYNPKANTMIWSSEGERIVKPGNIVLEDPAITIIQPDGQYIDTFVLPPNMQMQATENGPRQNGVFEGLTFANNYKNLYVSVEEPIYEDGPRAGTGDSTGWVRFLKFDMASHNPMAQYAYQIEPVAATPVPASGFKINGVTDILSVNDHQLLVIERSASAGRLQFVIRIFLADIKNASDISHITSLKKSTSFTPLKKKLLLNMNSLNRYVDNIEGVTFGPTLPNGHKTLLFVSDNNFLFFQKTQFLLFEVLP